MSHDRMHEGNRDRFAHRQKARILPFPIGERGGTPGGPTMKPVSIGSTTVRANGAPLAVGRPLHSIPHSTVGVRQAWRPGFNGKDSSTMNPSTIGLSHLYAKARHADFIADAERDRIAASAASGREGRQAVIALRMRIGAVLIRIGERLHGAIDERCGEVGALRPARS